MADIKRISNKNNITNGNELSNLSLSDILLTQHVTGDNSDYKMTVAQAQAIPYGVCSSAAGDDKTVTLSNYPSSFTAQVGTKILVKFSVTNTKGHVSDGTYPTLTAGGKTGAIMAQGQAVGSGVPFANQICELVWTGDGWNIDQNTREVTNDYNILTDNSLVYNKTQTDSKINTEISGLSGANIKATYEGETDYINTVLTKVGKVKTVNEQEPDENGNIEIDADSTIPSMTTAEYDELTEEEKNDGHIREITDAVGIPIPFAILNDEIKTSSNVYSAEKTMQEIAKTCTYSEEETVIGKWIDNKPIYRKVLEISNIVADKEVSVSNLNINKLLNISGFIEDTNYTVIIGNVYSTQYMYCGVIFKKSNNSLRFQKSSDLSSTNNGYIIIEYTKSTD